MRHQSHRYGMGMGRPLNLPIQPADLLLQPL
jgi:hypothetical protein